MKMYENVDEYIKRSREERRRHLDLSLCCIERGSKSPYFRGLLSDYLKVTIPENCKGRILLCHACNNDKCSNVKHLYYGTPKDNHIDAVENGTATNIFQSTVLKYGKERAAEMFRENAKKMGLSTPKNKRPISELLRYKDIIDNSFKEWGWKTKLARQLKMSRANLNRIIRDIEKL